MAAKLFFLPFPTAFNSNGLALPGAKLYFYATGTSTPAASYSNSGLTVENSHPVVANGAGRFTSVYLNDTLTYRLVIKDADDNTLDDIDPYVPGTLEGTEGEQGPPGDMSTDYKVKTPFMFGAVGDGVTDDTVALQAFFDDAADEENARTYVYDWSQGEYKVSSTIWANYTNNDANTPAQQFIGGTLRVVYSASPISVVLEILGYRQHWSGTVHIAPTGAVKYGLLFSERGFNIGVRIRAANGSVFENFKVDSARYDGVVVDSDSQGAYEAVPYDAGNLDQFIVRQGSDRETVYANSNCIGVKIGNISCRTVGSQHASAAYGWTTAVSAKSHGTGEGGSFAAGGGAGLTSQRTRLTVGSTANMREGDMGKMRHEITSSTYGTVAIDATVKTITWSAGDPVTAGMAVGDKYYVENDDSSATNAAIAFEILSFGGVSNRTITVAIPDDATMVTQAARSNLTLVTEYSIHTVMNITNGTTVEVYPWVPDRHNSVWKATCGAALMVRGRDAAWIHVGAVNSLTTGVCVYVNALYGPQIDFAGADYGDIGIRYGYGANASQSILGTQVSDAHLEGCIFPVYNHSDNTVSEIGGWSAFTAEHIKSEAPRAATTSLFMDARTAAGIFAKSGSGNYISDDQASYEGQHDSAAITYRYPDGYYLSNEAKYRNRQVVTDNATVQLYYSEDIAKNFAGNNTCALHWCDTDGGAPDGTLTINLVQSLIDKGWAFSNDYTGTSISITAPATPIDLSFRFLHATKKIQVVERP